MIGFPDRWENNNSTGGRGGDKGSRGRGGDRQGRGRGGRGSGFRAYNTQLGESSVSTTAASAGIPNFTQEQWESIAQFVNTQQPNQSEKQSGKKEQLFLYGRDRRYNIVIDSGASHHMTGDERLLTDIQTIAPCPIEMPNGQITWATRVGSLNLGGRLTLRHVFFASCLSITLISFSQLLRDVASFVLFTKKFCVIQDIVSKTLIGAGKERDGVYHYEGAIAVQDGRVSRLPSRDLWHHRMGHPSSKVLSVLASVAGFSSSLGVLEQSCDIFLRAKQTRDVFSLSINKAVSSFELIHVDLWGPYREYSTCGARYFLTVVDDFSRAVWTILLLEKSEAPAALKMFCTFVQRQFGTHVKSVRSDNGSEFMSLRKYFADEGICHQTSCVETPEQNGRVERKHRHILNVARALLFQGNLPKNFWGESVLTASYLINRTPTSLLQNKTPYEMLYGTLPTYDNLRVFGTLCFARRISRGKDKFDPRSIRCVFLGYPMGKKGWTVYDLETETMFVSRDVVFHEDRFPYKEHVTRKDVPQAVSTIPQPLMFEPETPETHVASAPVALEPENVTTEEG